MERGKIERTLRGHVKRGEGPWASINVERAATEIAKLFEKELEDKNMSIGVLKAAIEEWQLIADEYMAQLAEMRELIERVKDKAFAHWDEDSGTTHDWLWVFTVLRDVLAAPPEVLSGKNAVQSESKAQMPDEEKGDEEKP